MGICRIACLTSPLRLSHSHSQSHPHTSLLFPFYPRNSSTFSALPSPLQLKPFARTALSSPLALPSSMESPPPGYRRNVGICLINHDKKIFSASRLDVPASWQMPQGGIDDAEDPRSAAIRELREETGVTSAEILAEAPFWLTYDFPPHVREKLRHQWGQDWIGQAQKWFLFKFTGKDEEINLLGDGSEKPEFGNWSWLSPEQLMDLSVDFKKPVYEEAFAAFASHLQKHSPM